MCENKAPVSVCRSFWGSSTAEDSVGLHLGPCHLQAGMEGRESEGCATVGLLLEHSFEIGESSSLHLHT